MNLDYLFTGITVSEELMSTYIYHFSDVAKLNDPSGINFKSLFTTNGLSASALAKGQATFSVNFINSSSLDGVIDPIDALSARSNMFRPNFTYTLESYNAN